MNGQLQSRINPVTPSNSINFSDAPVKTPEKAKDGGPQTQTSFKDLLLNSNDDIAKQRAAQKNGDGLRGAKSDAEFAKMLADRMNRENLRTPQNNLDKDAFLKLFVTQMQNQDPLNPDDSAEMAAQLAQFNGLEQMMNVNKNLEKMQAEQAIGRSVGLTSFIGKEIKVGGGRVMLSGGRTTDCRAQLASDAMNTTLEVRNSAGVLVATRELGPLQTGERQIAWDGLDAKGQKATDGVYTLSLTTKTANGQILPIDLTANLTVKGVDLRESGGSFYTEVGPVKVTEVASVGERGYSQAGSPGKVPEVATADPTSGDSGPTPAAPSSAPLPGPASSPGSSAVQAVGAPSAQPKAPPKISRTGEIIPS